MNGRELAKKITETEGGKVNLPIAQVAEVLACLADYALEHPVEHAQAWARLLARAAKRARR